jgi:hypothetical protein
MLREHIVFFLKRNFTKFSLFKYFLGEFRRNLGIIMGKFLESVGGIKKEFWGCLRDILEDSFGKS